MRACKNVAVLLTEVVGDVHYHAYEIAIAADGAEKTSIRDVSSGTGMQEVKIISMIMHVCVCLHCCYVTKV